MRPRNRVGRVGKWLVGLFGGVAVTACGSVSAASQNSAHAHHSSVARQVGKRRAMAASYSGLIAAGAANGPDAWALTSKGLLLSDNGGAAWHPAHLPGTPAAYAATAAFTISADNAGTIARIGTKAIWIATIDRTGQLTLMRSDNAGLTWSVAQITRIQAGSQAKVQIILSSTQVGSITVQGPSTVTTSGNEVFLTSNGGRTFTEHPIPTQGIATFSSARNGVLIGNEGEDVRPGFDWVFRTNDGGATLVRAVVSAPSAPAGLALGPALNTAGALIAVTVPPSSGDARTLFQLLAQSSTGAHSYRPIGVPVHASADPGNTALIASLLGRHVWVLSADDKTIYMSTDLGERWSSHSVSGLPSGALWLSQTGLAAGLVMTEAGHCKQFKRDCTNTVTVYHTNDDGHIWTTALTGSFTQP
jgi:hypothetical protein